VTARQSGQLAPPAGPTPSSGDVPTPPAAQWHVAPVHPQVQLPTSTRYSVHN
jgi:hypothetical protein